MTGPLLVIFSGLPGSGKSTLAQALAKHLRCTYVRIDTLEQGLKEVCKIGGVEGEGYRLSYRIVSDNLGAGNIVIADSVNPFQFTREEWNQVAISADAPYINIEIVCSDKEEHKVRIETRKVGVKNLKLPTWEEVLKRDYHEWDMPRIQIDTASRSVDDCVDEIVAHINNI